MGYVSPDITIKCVKVSETKADEHSEVYNIPSLFTCI